MEMRKQLLHLFIVLTHVAQAMFEETNITGTPFISNSMDVLKSGQLTNQELSGRLSSNESLSTSPDQNVLTTSATLKQSDIRDQELSKETSESATLKLFDSHISDAETPTEEHMNQSAVLMPTANYTHNLDNKSLSSEEMISPKVEKRVSESSNSSKAEMSISRTISSTEVETDNLSTTDNLKIELTDTVGKVKAVTTEISNVVQTSNQPSTPYSGHHDLGHWPQSLHSGQPNYEPFTVPSQTAAESGVERFNSSARATSTVIPMFPFINNDTSALTNDTPTSVIPTSDPITGVSTAHSGLPKFSSTINDTMQNAIIRILRDLQFECLQEHQCDGTEWDVIPRTGPCQLCQKCICGDFCYHQDNCCLEKILDDLGVLMESTPSCHSVNFTFHPYPNYFIMKDTCGGEAGHSASTCVHGAGVDDLWPVWSPLTGMTYRNKECGRCNGEEEGQLVLWDVRVECNSSVLLQHTGSGVRDILQMVLDLPFCCISSSPPPDSRTELCSPWFFRKTIICPANTSNQNRLSNIIFSTACGAFYSYGPPLFPPVSSWTQFCAMCGFHPDNSCGDISSDVPFPFVLVISSNALSDVAAATTTTRNRCQCAADEIYDKYESRCRRIECSATRRLEQGRCQLVARESLGQGYEVNLRLTPITAHQDLMVKNLSSLRDVAFQFFTAFMRLTLADASFQFDEFWIVAHTRPDKELQTATQFISCVSFDLKVRVVNVAVRDVQDVENDLFHVTQNGWIIPISTGTDHYQLIYFQASALYSSEREYERTKHLTRVVGVDLLMPVGVYKDYLISLEYHDRYLRLHFTHPIIIEVDTYYLVQESMNCTKTAFPLSTNVKAKDEAVRSSNENVGMWEQNPEGNPVLQSIGADTGELILALDIQTGSVYHYPSGRRVGHQYVEMPRDDLVLVCVDQLFGTSSSSPDPLVLERFFSLHMIYTSVVCQSLSVVCLFIVFITYCLFPELRTLPGQNTMGLVASLLLAMLLFELGVARVEFPLLCKVLGILIHFSLLSSFTWMVICSASMFRAFTCVLTSRHNFPTLHSSFLKHLAFSLLVPAAIVTFTLLGNWVAHLDDCELDLGYGRGICYLSNVWSLVLASVVPVCLAVVINLLLFLAMLRSLRCLNEQVKRATREHRQQLTVYVRMSSLTGINWLTGLVTAVIDSVVVWYIFIILCGLQGLYVFLAFVCNRRVLSLYRALLYGKRQKATSREQAEQEAARSTPETVSSPTLE